MSIFTRKEERYTDGFEKKQVTIYICPHCWYESRYLGVVRRHMAEKHTVPLDKFIEVKHGHGSLLLAPKDR